MDCTTVPPPRPTASNMKLCPKCDNSPMPFLMVLMVAGISAFMTWLTMGLSTPVVWIRLAASALIFAAVGGTLLHYVLGCLKRHCRHGKESPVTRRRHAAEHHPRQAA